MKVTPTDVAGSFTCLKPHLSFKLTDINHRTEGHSSVFIVSGEGEIGRGKCHLCKWAWDGRRMGGP